jgi:hypothetical protein
MNQFRNLNDRIQKATFEELSDLARAVEGTRKLTGTERIVLEKGIANRRDYLARAASA